ncbi:hypothetical protein [Sphingobium sp. WCS2017Hpa-17]|uniref:hypothetical protein n=1 Tax=Sphingobium sp. WCS2017Hpa-17 TaxID=3073638 RepID=UPI00288A5999|nr:hypothetical protein [Sphingobium sp. WCS2017Hpa-17]
MKSEGNPPIFSGIFVIEKQVSRFASLLRAAQINVQRIASRPADKKGLVKACHIGHRLCICKVSRTCGMKDQRGGGRIP